MFSAVSFKRLKDSERYVLAQEKLGVTTAVPINSCIYLYFHSG